MGQNEMGIIPFTYNLSYQQLQGEGGGKKGVRKEKFSLTKS